MGTVINANTAVNADIDITGLIPADRIHWTGRAALSTLNAEFLLYLYTSAGPLLQTAGWAGCNAGSRVAGQAANSNKTRGQTTAALNQNPAGFPGKTFVDKAGTGKRTGMAADTTIHTRRR